MSSPGFWNTVNTLGTWKIRFQVGLGGLVVLCGLAMFVYYMFFYDAKTLDVTNARGEPTGETVSAKGSAWKLLAFTACIALITYARVRILRSQSNLAKAYRISAVF